MTSFSVDPYQLGFENAEAIDSGAFWFYRKLGFRPTDAGVRRLLEREERRIAADPSHRSSPATLRRLVTHNLLYEIPGSPRGEWDRFHIRNLGLAVNRRMAREFGGDAARLRAASEKRVARAARPAPRSADGRASGRPSRELALVLDLVPGLARWSRQEKDGVVAIVRAKARGVESRYLRLLQRHAPPARRADPPRIALERQRPLRAATIWARTARAISSGDAAAEVEADRRVQLRQVRPR